MKWKAKREERERQKERRAVISLYYSFRVLFCFDCRRPRPRFRRCSISKIPFFSRAAVIAQPSGMVCIVAATNHAARVSPGTLIFFYSSCVFPVKSFYLLFFT